MILHELNSKNYYSINLFSNPFSFSEYFIYNTITSDLFHQISKNFYNQVFKKWYSVIVKNGSNVMILDIKLNTRFQHISAYQRLRWFNHEISYIKWWIRSEYKEMMKVFIRIARELCDKILLSMIKIYIDIYWLLYYESHLN